MRGIAGGNGSTVRQDGLFARGLSLEFFALVLFLLVMFVIKRPRPRLN